MSHATPLPGVPAHSPHSADLAARIQEFQAAMFRVNDCLQRVGGDPIDGKGPYHRLGYIERQLMLAGSNLDAARFAVTAIMELAEHDISQIDDMDERGHAATIGTPDGSGRNSGGAL